MGYEISSFDKMLSRPNDLAPNKIVVCVILCFSLLNKFDWLKNDLNEEIFLKWKHLIDKTDNYRC
jgi:hypothetical protein